MAILYYTQQDEYDLVHSGQYCIGKTVVDQTGTPIGTVTEMLINTDTDLVDSILIDRRKRIPAQDFALQGDRVVVRGVMHDGELEMSEQANAADTSNQTHEALPQRNAAATHVEGVTRAADEGAVVIPIIEEQLSVGKRTIETGAARVRTSIEEVPVQESVTLREENVTVERHPVNRAVTDADTANFREGVVELTEKKEVAVVAKEARVVEEVEIGKNVTEREQIVSDTVKHTEVDVEELTDVDARRQRNG